MNTPRTNRRRLLRRTLRQLLCLAVPLPWLPGLPSANAAKAANTAMPATAAMAAKAAALPAARPPALSEALRLALPAATAQQALLATVEQLPDGHPRRRRYRLAIPFDTPLFPPDTMLVAGVPGWQEDAALAAWLALPRKQRRYDVLLMPDEDYFWPERGADGASSDYAAQFIVHLAPPWRTGGAAGATALAIVQVHARRRHGKVFRLLGRTGPGFYWEIRPAQPAPGAAAALADDLARWLGALRPRQPA